MDNNTALVIECGTKEEVAAAYDKAIEEGDYNKAVVLLDEVHRRRFALPPKDTFVKVRVGEKELDGVVTRHAGRYMMVDLGDEQVSFSKRTYRDKTDTKQLNYSMP